MILNLLGQKILSSGKLGNGSILRQADNRLTVIYY